MKKVLKTVVVLAVLIITTNANAQRFGIRGGVNFSNMSTKLNNSSKFVQDDREFLIGYNVGLTAEIDFHENFGFETGLIFNSKGLKYAEEVAGIKTEISRRLHYLDIPVLAKGMYNFSGVEVFGKFGPYVGIGLVGKDKVTNKKLNIDKSIDTKWGDDPMEMNRLDYGLQMGLGTEIGGFIVEGIYKFSLGDIDNAETTTTKNHVLALSVGYNLGF